MLKAFLSLKFTKTFFVSIIILNAILLGLSASSRNFVFLNTLESVILWLFVVEMTLKLLAFRLDFFKSKANVFDLAVVAFCMVPEFTNISILRFLRIFTLLRLFSVVPQFKFIIAVILKTIPSTICMGTVLLLVLYVYAVLCVYLFGAHFPEIFGSLGVAFLSLFQVATLDGWSVRVAPVIEYFSYAWVVFVSFILIVSFVMLNIIVGLIVDNINHIRQHDKSNFKE